MKKVEVVFDMGVFWGMVIALAWSGAWVAFCAFTGLSSPVSAFWSTALCRCGVLDRIVCLKTPRLDGASCQLLGVGNAVVLCLLLLQFAVQ